ncbi:hypothetical protein [Magnetovibrio blakemorei]|uniref:hypothetical protein n=1 Tax=Magnetovibrio blakemorei TaxID=28181 RepID=UPI001112D121|nr:hypothetical protein [Magnetovibrio blakemorei]
MNILYHDWLGFYEAKRNFEDTQRQKQSEISQFDTKIVNIESTNTWLDMIPNIRIDLNPFYQSNEKLKRDCLTKYVKRIGVRYDEESRQHHLKIRVRVPIWSAEGIGTNMVRNGKNQPEMLFTITPRLPTWPGCAAGRRPCL